MDIPLTQETTGAADLVSRIMAGDQQAEEELVQRYRRGVRFIIDQLVRNRSDTEDLVQETFIIALKNIRRGDLRDRESLPAYICGIAKNVVSGLYRKAWSGNFTAIDEIPPPIDPNRNPLEQLLQNENDEIVRQVIGELRIERDRLVLFLFYILEEEKESICASLGLTSTHFNRVIFRARGRFKELYQEKFNR